MIYCLPLSYQTFVRFLLSTSSQTHSLPIFNDQEYDKCYLYRLVNVGKNIWNATGNQVPRDDGDDCQHDQ